MLRLILYIALWLVPLCAGAQYSRPIIFDTDNGLPSSTVYDILEDEKGFIWIATNRGLVRWDGERFRTFTLDDGLPDLEVMRLALDHEGRLWIMTFSQGFCYYKDEVIHNRHNDELLKKAWKPGYIGAMHQTTDHRLIFFHIQKGNIVIDGNEVTYNDEWNELKGVNSKFLLEDEKGNLWRPWGYGQHTLIGDAKNRPIRENPLAIHNVTIASASQGPGRKVYVPFEEGIIEMNGFEWKVVVRYPVGNDRAIRVWLLPSGDLMLSIQHKGLIRFRSTGAGAWSSAPEVIESSGTISAVCELSGGGLLTGNVSSGMNLRFATPIRSYADEEIYPATAALCGLLDAEGNLWVMSDKKNLWLYPTGRVSVIPQRIEAHFMNASLMRQLGKGIMAIGGEKLILFRPGQVFGLKDVFEKYSYVFQEKTEVRPHVQALYKGPFSIFYQVGLVKDVIMRSRTGRISFSTSFGIFEIAENDRGGFDTLPSIYQGRTHCLAEGEDGSLFFSTPEGIYTQVGNERARSVARLSPLLQLPAMSMAFHPQGGLILVNARGLVQWYQGKVSLLKLPLSDKGEHFNSVAFDSLGRLWVTGNRGIHRFAFQQGRATWQLNWNAGDGLASNEVSTLFFDGDSVYACTAKGLSVFHAEEKRNRPEISIPVYITSVSLSGRDSLLPNPFSIPHLFNNIRFEFAGIAFASLGQMKYQYRLLGLDTAWIATPEPEASFSFLQPGTYTLEVIAIDKDGNRSAQPARMQFTILTPWYRSLWFKLSLALSLLVIAGGFLWVRYRIRQRQAELKRRITEAEHKALRAQMNPHFIFNAMNSIQRFLATNDRKEAITYFSRFGRLIRLILDASRNQAISLADEIQTLTLYAQLEQLRTDHQFQFQILVPPDLDPLDLHLPPMLVQPYLENSIWHGVMHKEGKGQITISVSLSGESLRFVIEDDGVGRAAAAELKAKHRAQHQSHGTRITEERLQMLNERAPGSASVNFTDLFRPDGSPAGTRVTVLLPLMD